MRRRTTTVRDDEVFIVEVECCEGEENQLQALLIPCHKMRCPLYQRALTASIAVCLPHGYTPTHENVLDVSRKISKLDREEPEKSVPLDGFDEEDRPRRDDRDDDLWDWNDERE